MKSILFISLLLSICISASAQTIDSNDSVFFDLTNVIVDGDYIDIPVSIKSDDVINALDFWLKYNHDDLLYMTIINNTTYIQPIQFYNPDDSTIRFSSNSFTTYEQHPVVLVYIRFQVLNAPIDGSDFNSIGSLLNGDSCTSHLINDVILGIDDAIRSNDVRIFPNPANKFVTIESSTKSLLKLFDLKGREMMSRELANSYKSFYQLDISSLPNGIYIAQFIADTEVRSLKLVVNNK